MKCPLCGYEDNLVKAARNVEKGRIRYRKCNICNKNFKSIEKYAWEWPDENPIEQGMNLEELQNYLKVELRG